MPVTLAGWAVRDRSGELYHGSAAAVGEDPSPRAAYELIERLSVHWALSGPASGRLALHTRRGRLAGWRAAQSVFPEFRARGRFRLSISNGVAAHCDADRAREAAFLELIERDRILRSWYGGSPPRQVEPGDLTVAGALKHLYGFECYALEAPDDPDPDVAVCALFGFPRASGDPLAIGFGAAREWQAALWHAERELLQRVGFLWGEALPAHAPELRPDPAYHLDLYLWPGGHTWLRGWLRGEHERLGVSRARRRADARSVRFADLTPDPLAGELHVAKALCARRLPLAFGDYEAFGRFSAGQGENDALALEFPPHPIA